MCYWEICAVPIRTSTDRSRHCPKWAPFAYGGRAGACEHWMAPKGTLCMQLDDSIDRLFDVSTFRCVVVWPFLFCLFCHFGVSSFHTCSACPSVSVGLQPKRTQRLSFLRRMGTNAACRPICDMLRALEVARSTSRSSSLSAARNRSAENPIATSLLVPCMARFPPLSPSRHCMPTPWPPPPQKGGVGVPMTPPRDHANGPNDAHDAEEARKQEFSRHSHSYAPLLHERTPTTG